MTTAEPAAPGPDQDWSAALPAVAREVELFLRDAGWDQPPLLFALVPTSTLLAAQPGLADRLAGGPDDPPGSGLTPVAQDPVEEPDLAALLEGIYWPDEVAGCALAQEIVVLPPDAEAELDAAVAARDGGSDAELSDVAVRVARGHPERREARLVVAVSRSGGRCCLLRLRGEEGEPGDGPGEGGAPDELVEHPDLAPNMVNALLRTLDAGGG